MSPARLLALSEPRWEADEQRTVEAAPDYQPPARRGSLDDSDGPSEWDRW